MGTIGVILPSNNTILESYLQHLYDVNQEKKKACNKKIWVEGSVDAEPIAEPITEFWDKSSDVFNSQMVKDNKFVSLNISFI